MRDIRRRIRSVKNTAQITRAMQLVAASKMKKAQDQAVAGRPYADLINKVLVNLRDRSGDDPHPFLVDRPVAKELMVVISTDKGLCGGLNTNLLRLVLKESEEYTEYVTVGKKVGRSLAKMKKKILADFPASDPLRFVEAKQVASFVSQKFSDGSYDRVKVAFTNFVNTLSQVPHVETLLPVSELGVRKDYEGVGVKLGEMEVAPSVGYLFEPDPAEVFGVILPQYVNYSVYQMILESRASEHSSRMVAMKSATDNANDLIKELSREYNKLRQASITNELLEISTAQKALE